MTTCHGGAGHACEDRDLNPHIEDARNIDMCPRNNNEAQTVWILQLLSEVDARQTWTY